MLNFTTSQRTTIRPLIMTVLGKKQNIKTTTSCFSHPLTDDNAGKPLPIRKKNEPLNVFSSPEITLFNKRRKLTDLFRGDGDREHCIYYTLLTPLHRRRFSSVPNPWVLCQQRARLGVILMSPSWSFISWSCHSLTWHLPSSHLRSTPCLKHHAAD